MQGQNDRSRYSKSLGGLITLWHRVAYNKFHTLPCDDRQLCHPEQIRQRVKVPDVKLVVKRPTETHADEDRRKHNRLQR